MKIIAFLLLLCPIFSFGNSKQHSQDSIRSIVFTKDSLEIINHITKSSKDKGFLIWFHYSKKVDAIMGNDYAERNVMNIIMQEDPNVVAANQKAIAGLKVIVTIGTQTFYEAPDKNTARPIPPDWKRIYASIKNEYGNYYAKRVSKFVQTNYYGQRRDWANYDAVLTDYVNQYQSIFKAAQLNESAWEIFSHSDNKKQLKSALHWSNSVINAEEKGADEDKYLDTYANLLYKIGRNNEAMSWEAKALLSAPTDRQKDYTQTLEKMRSGVKTW